MKIAISLNAAYVSDRNVLSRIQTLLRNKDWNIPMSWYALQKSNDKYPALGRIDPSFYDGWHIAEVQNVGKNKYKLNIMPISDLSNSLYRLRSDTNNPLVKKAEAKAKEVAKSFTSNKLKAKVVPNAQNMQVNIEVVFAFDPTDDAHVPKYGIRVTGQDGTTSVFTMTPNSAGPWLYEDVRNHIADLAENLKYDDDFKNPKFQIVAVKSKS